MAVQTENFPCYIIDPMNTAAGPEWAGDSHDLLAANDDGEGDVEALLEALQTLKADGDAALCGFIHIVRGVL